MPSMHLGLTPTIWTGEHAMNTDGRDQNGPLMLTAEETAALLGLSRSKVYEMIAAGELPVVRFGRSVRVNRAKLLAQIEERTTKGN